MSQREANRDSEKGLASSDMPAPYIDYYTSLIGEGLTDVIDTSALSQADVDVIEWINTSLSRLGKAMPSLQANHEAAATTKEKEEETANQDISCRSLYQNMSASEQMVNTLYNHVQQHRHTLSDTVENLIAQTVARLPRTTLELSRMMEGTDEAAARLQHVHDRVTQRPNASAPAEIEKEKRIHYQTDTEAARSEAEEQQTGASNSSKDNEQLTRKLRQLKVVESKLRGCCEAIDTSARVEENITAIESAIAQMRGGVYSSDKDDVSPNNSTRKTMSGNSVSKLSVKGNESNVNANNELADIDAIAEAIRVVKKDLAYLRSVEPCYGQKHQVALDRYEAFVETALERECLSHFSLRNVRRAAHLYHTLDTIDRADSMLDSYAHLAVQHTCDRIDELLRGSNRQITGDSSSSGVISASEAISVLRVQIVPLLTTVLSNEFDFMHALAQELNHVLPLQDSSASPPGGVDPDSGAPMNAAAQTHADPQCTSTTATAAFNTTSPTVASASAAVTKILNLMDRMLTLLGDAFTRAMTPVLLSRVTHNRDLVACYLAVRELRIGHSNSNSAHNSVSGSDTVPEQRAESAYTTATSMHLSDSTSVRTAAAKVTATGVEVLSRVFHSEAVLRDFCDRASRQLLPALQRTSFLTRHGPAAHHTPDHPDAYTAGAAPPTAGENVNLDDSTFSATVASALQEGVHEVMLYFPDRTAVPCLQMWSASLIDALVTPLSCSSSATNDAEGVNTVCEAGTACSMSATELVERLYLAMTRVRPMLLQWQRELVHFLSDCELVLAQGAQANPSARTGAPATNLATTSGAINGNSSFSNDNAAAAASTTTNRLLTSSTVTASAPMTTDGCSVAVKELVCTLSQHLWSPVLTCLDACIGANQQLIERRLLAPVLEKTALYTTLPVWGAHDPESGVAHLTGYPARREGEHSSENNHANDQSTKEMTMQQQQDSSAVRPVGLVHGSSDVGLGSVAPTMTAEAALSCYDVGHMTPSQPVRDLGEAIMEVPLMLDALCAEVSGAMDTPRQGVHSMLDELVESWLEHVVHAAVNDFVRHKLLRVRIHVARVVVVNGASSCSSTERGEVSWSCEMAAALRQVETDLSYLKNVLSAVNEERFEVLESVLDGVRELAPGDIDITRPLVLHRLIHVDDE